MWHEARKQERKIRGMLVDYRKRAERRRDFYEKIKADPTQFLQVHGRQCKIHLDPTIAAAADGPATMMPWQGQNDNLIDRFDVRAHLDYIPSVKIEDDDELTYEERQINYERYRIIAQNSFLVISEEKFLKQLHLEEQFGYTENEPKKRKVGGAAIGFNYEDGTGTSQSVPLIVEEENSEDNSDSDLDVDLSINVSKLDQGQAHEMNRHGRNFGMSSNDFYSFLTHDLEEAESFRLAKEEEHEKALFSGRKSRRERRAHREKRLANRKISPPSYAARESPTLKLDFHDKSESRSPSPENAGKITFITSFGGEEETQMPIKPTYADKVKFGNKLKKLREISEERIIYRETSMSVRSTSRDKISFRKRHRNTSRDKSRRSRSRSRRIRSRRSTSSDSRSRSRDRKSSSRSMSRSKRSYSRSRRSSESRSKSLRRSRSRSNHRTKVRKIRSKSRSKSRCRSLPRNRSRSRSRSRRSRSNSVKTYSNSRSKSPSRSKSKSKSVSKSRSRSKSRQSFSSSSSTSRSSSKNKEAPPKALPRYYGRRKSDQSSSELGESSDEDNNKPIENLVTQNTSVKIGNSGTSTKAASATSLSLQERLKRKRQALLNKQFKADKIAEQMKTEREKQEQQTREDELREMALKIRRKQRERRHAYDSDSSDSSSNSESKGNNSPSENKKSRSPSPKPRDYREREYRSRERDYKYRTDRESDYKKTRYRENSRDRSDRYGSRTSKSRYDEKRDEDRDRHYRDDRRRDSYRGDREKKDRSSSKALVDY